MRAILNDECISAFDVIKNDEVVLEREKPDKKGGPKRVTIDFGMLNGYAAELNAVLQNAAFIGVTHIPIQKSYVESKPLDAALLHFRGFERGDSLCLYYQRAAFPLVPSPAARYIPASERKLSYFEHVMSGLSGLRVSRVHCPFFFKNIIAIDLKPPHQYSSDDAAESTPESYRILFITHPKGNRLVMTDNNDGTILLTSNSFDEKSGIKDGVGSLFRVEQSRKATPDPTESYEDFAARFQGRQHMSLLKAMVMTYEGIDARRITHLAGKAGIDSTRHISKLENLEDFYNSFIRWLRSPVDSSDQLHFALAPTEHANPDENIKGDDMGQIVDDPATSQKDGASTSMANSTGIPTSDARIPRTLIRYVFHHWGASGIVYKHHRLAEDSRVLIDETKERLEEVRKQCIGDEQQAERLAKVQQRLNDIGEYDKSLTHVMKWKGPEQFDLVKTIYEQVYRLGDLTGYRSKAAPKQFSRGYDESEYINDEEEERNVPHFKPKKHNPFKGILVIKTHPQNPDTALIIVGRNAKQNETVTHELSQAGDIWLHTKDCPGSHVLLRRHSGSGEALQIAADIAAYYSKAKKEQLVPVIKTAIENVKKCPDAQIGAVLVSNFDTIHGRPTNGGEYVKAHRISLN
ncbi:protein of unknown function (DUF814) containing protein [Babesia divergens]|uniref:NFACT RNA-binding domain-containing protein n=1 Tax=Babesia divergens TaxID=32595 RepID=A0AAD9GEW2_BABDI|nr:protein of unknown function (DUF814) containing protein [Babesia divergens]